MTKEEVWQKVSQIVADYPLLECARCAASVMQWLQDNGIEGKILRLRTKRRSEVFIISDRYGGNESITENGTHYGVEVYGLVFDNLSTEGLSRDAWTKDFHSRSDKFVIDELTSL
ncbi:MAG: hypothetical protein KME09_01775 [Pleurocapsa minor HA4230-MV1]|jgi:hypothetical protein|nr:hypothetical protein [Pleurocapsa minor HA4230-MV1]